MQPSEYPMLSGRYAPETSHSPDMMLTGCLWPDGDGRLDRARMSATGPKEKWRKGMWNRSFLRFTLIEWLVAVVFLLIIARFFWAKELAGFDDKLLAPIGLDGAEKYLVALPLVGYVYYRLYKRAQFEAREMGRKAVRPQVLAIAIAILVTAIAAVVFITP